MAKSIIKSSSKHKKSKVSKSKSIIVDKKPKKKIVLPPKPQISLHKTPESIHSLKELEEKILEKYEEHKPEPIPLVEPKIELEVKHEKTVVVKEKKPAPETTDYKTKVEAILFAVGKYLEDEVISQLCDIDKRNVKKALEELRTDYDSRDTALMIVQEGNNWKINVREKYLPLVRKIVADTELSKSVMETLAVIAWKTPVYQNEVVRIRGNKCYDHIAELETAGFVTKDKKGRSYVLKTTDKFYNYFDIDQKNLQGVMSEAKLPTAQTTLVEADKPEEQTYSREKLLHALETIETKSIVQTDEDKTAQKEFLDNMHQKILNSAKRTDEVIAEIPKPMHQQEQPALDAEEVPPEVQSDAVLSKDDEDIVIDTGASNDAHHFQKPEEQPQKIKQLTRKQLEKKFKEELQRVKDKGDSKK
jgi:segregation and condensation protein B